MSRLLPVPQLGANRIVRACAIAIVLCSGCLATVDDETVDDGRQSWSEVRSKAGTFEPSLLGGPQTDEDGLMETCHPGTSGGCSSCLARLALGQLYLRLSQSDLHKIASGRLVQLHNQAAARWPSPQPERELLLFEDTANFDPVSDQPDALVEAQFEVPSTWSEEVELDLTLHSIGQAGTYAADREHCPPEHQRIPVRNRSGAPNDNPTLDTGVRPASR